MKGYEDVTVADVLAAYERGERSFVGIRIERAAFHGRRLQGVTFIDSVLRGATFDHAKLSNALFFDSDLTEASLESADLNRATFRETHLPGAWLGRAILAGATLDVVNVDGADLTGCFLGAANLLRTDLKGATLHSVVLGRTAFSDVDVSQFCDAVDLFHAAPSYVDFRSVMRSYRHPGLKRFLMDCGVPPVVAEFTIAAAEADGESALGSLMQSTFLSYGGPDEAFARRLYDALRENGVVTFFFPETARLGQRIGDEVRSRIQEHDRVILVCSRDSLDRPGVRTEIQETFDREARDGGATYLLPIMLDDYVLSGWQDPLAERVRDRVVGDFRGALDDAVFDKAMGRLLAALRKQPG